MKIAIICYLFLMNVINFEAVAGLFQHKVDSLSLLKEAYRNRDEKTFFDLFPHLCFDRPLSIRKVNQLYVEMIQQLPQN